MSLTLNAVIQFFHRTLWFMMLYYQTKFGCERTSSLEDRVEIVLFWLYKPSLWPWIEDSEPIFLHDTLAHNAALQYQVWYQNDLRFRRYHPDKHSLTSWTFVMILTLNTVIQILHRTLWLMMLYYQCKFGCKQTSSLEDIEEIVIFCLYKLSLWPWH